MRGNHFGSIITFSCYICKS